MEDWHRELVLDYCYNIMCTVLGTFVDLIASVTNIYAI
jgi:hypothetical protein